MFRKVSAFVGKCVIVSLAGYGAAALINDNMHRIKRIQPKLYASIAHAARVVPTEDQAVRAELMMKLSKDIPREELCKLIESGHMHEIFTHSYLEDVANEKIGRNALDSYITFMVKHGRIPNLYHALRDHPSLLTHAVIISKS